jgi:hypothetical protein
MVMAAEANPSQLGQIRAVLVVAGVGPVMMEVPSG